MADKNIYELIQQWCENQNRSIYSLYKEEGGELTESTLQSIKKGDNPEYATLKILAKKLHVPVPDFLIGPGNKSLTLTEEEQKVVETLRSFDDVRLGLALRLLGVVEQMDKIQK